MLGRSYERARRSYHQLHRDKHHFESDQILPIEQDFRMPVESTNFPANAVNPAGRAEVFRLQMP